jgi:hypothetical protein
LVISTQTIERLLGGGGSARSLPLSYPNSPGTKTPGLYLIGV